MSLPANEAILLNERARKATTSAIRDLLEHAQRPGMISLAGGLPDPELFPSDQLAAIAADTLRNEPGVLQYGLTAGELDLRNHIVETTPAALDADHVIITTGSQQALHLLGEILLEPGDTVVTSDPDYLGAMQTFRGKGALLTPITVDHDGMVVDDLEARLEDGLRPKLVYLVPHFHNPSGATLAGARLTRLLELASDYGFLVVLDDPYRELYVDGGPPGELARHPMSVHLRSTSKVLAPGLRVGWMIAPKWLTEAAERAKQSADLHTSTLSQSVALGAMQAGWFPDHLNGIRAAMADKRDALCDALDEQLGSRCSFSRPAGGMFVWAAFSGIDSTATLLSAALDRGVAFVPGSAFSVGEDLPHHLRLSWATASPTQLVEAVTRLKLAIDAATA